MYKFKEKFGKINLSKNSFIDEFLDYLQKGNDNVPLDIINSKIEIIDFIYVPFLECDFNATAQVSATIGNDRVEWEKEKTGRVKIEYEKDWLGHYNRYETPEEETVAKTYTYWDDQKFTVDESYTSAFCGYNSKEKYNTYYGLFIKNSTSIDTENRNKNIKLLDINVNTDTKFNEYKKVVKEKLKNKINTELKKRGDHYKNLRTSDIDITKEITCYWEPMGYIKYHYGSDNKDYYFIKSLYSKNTVESSIPIDNEFSSKNAEGCGLSILVFVFYSAICYLVYLLTNIINLSYSKYLFYFISAILLIDFFSIFSCYASNRSHNVEKRQMYISSLFKANEDKLKKWISNLNKPYKD